MNSTSFSGGSPKIKGDNANWNTSNADIDMAQNTNVANAMSINVTGDDDNRNEFSEHLSTSNNIELEYKRIANERNGWQRLYQEIRERCDQEANEKHFETSESEKPQNRCLNRYRDVSPYDHSRIIIHRGRIDYINANLVELKDAERKYILTQGPLCDTVGHFWLMIWEQNTKAIIMLNKLMEKKQIKCHMYWPAHKGSEHAIDLKEVNLTVELLRCEQYKNFCRRWLKLTDLESNTSREITQFHYTTWPDFGIPSSPVAFLHFLKEVRDSGALDKNVGPAVVHCSAGIGRSGTFCLVDCCLVLIDNQGFKVSVQDVLYELRKYRMGLIQTADQLFFSYQAIIEGIKLLKKPEFINFKETPLPITDEEEKCENQIVDEIPPPLPPRTHSLTSSTGMTNTDDSSTLNLDDNISHGKPLPKIPVSLSFNNDLYVSDDNERPLVKNPERNIDHVSNRPLPPLPKLQQNSLHLLHEATDSDDNEYLEGDQSDDADIVNDDDDDNEYNTEEHIKKQNSERSNGFSEEVLNTENITQHAENGTNVQAMKAIRDGSTTKLNGKEDTKYDASINTSTVEWRRRQRNERKTYIEQKIQDIKRKQCESEKSKQAAKKRQSFVTYITAGVIVGVICVYAYSKWT